MRYGSRQLEIPAQSSGTNEGEPPSSPVGQSTRSTGGITDDEEFAERKKSWLKRIRQGALSEEEFQSIAKDIADGAEYLQVQTRTQRERIERTAKSYESLEAAHRDLKEQTESLYSERDFHPPTRESTRHDRRWNARGATHSPRDGGTRPRVHSAERRPSPDRNHRNRGQSSGHDQSGHRGRHKRHHGARH